MVGVLVGVAVFVLVGVLVGVAVAPSTKTKPSSVVHGSDPPPSSISHPPDTGGEQPLAAKATVVFPLLTPVKLISASCASVTLIGDGQATAIQIFPGVLVFEAKKQPAKKALAPMEVPATLTMPASYVRPNV
jgi:hypothetical protein